MGKKLGGTGEWTKNSQEFDNGGLLPLFLYYGSRVDIFTGKYISASLSLTATFLCSHSNASNGGHSGL